MAVIGAGTDSYRGLNVLITGHTGFKGAWLALWLETLGARVTGMSLRPEKGSLYDRAGLQGRWPEVFRDIRDRSAVVEAVQRFEPTLVFHLAAQPLVRVGYSDPTFTIETNVLGTMNVLEAVRVTESVTGCIVITTDKVYRNDNSGRAHLENDALGGSDPYSASKAAAEHLARAWGNLTHLQSGARIVTARAGNVIGGGDVAVDRLLPDLVRAFSAGKPAVIRHPDYTRPWQHVLDPLSGYLRLGAHIMAESRIPDAVNFGPDKETAVATVATRAASLWGNGAAWVEGQADSRPEMRLLALDSSLARTALGWHPRWTTERAVEATVSWWKHYFTDRSALDLCLEDIATYSLVSP